MDLNTTNRSQIHEFHKKFKIYEIFIFQATVLQMQNFNTKSPKFCQFGQKTTWTWGFKTIIIMMGLRM